MKNTVVKETKKDVYTQMIDLFNHIEGADVQKYIDFCTGEIELLDRKAQKAKETAERKKSEGDELRDAVENVLMENDAFMSIDEIMAALGDNEDITRSKVIYRLSALAGLGRVEKDERKTENTEGGRARKMAIYKIVK